MLTRLSPFFVTLFAYIILKESVARTSWLIFFPMIIGCVLIIKPNSAMFNPASIFAICSACSGALAYTMIKSIGKDESAYTIIFWLLLFDAMAANLLVLSGKAEQFNDYRFFKRYMTLQTGWVVYYLVLVGFIGFLIYG